MEQDKRRARQALRNYKRMLALEPAHTGHLEQIARLLVELGDHRQAARYFLQRAEVLEARDEPAAALASIRAALQCDPQNPRARDMLSLLRRTAPPDEILLPEGDDAGLLPVNEALLATDDPMLRSDGIELEDDESFMRDAFLPPARRAAGPRPARAAGMRKAPPSIDLSDDFSAVVARLSAGLARVEPSAGPPPAAMESDPPLDANELVSDLVEVSAEALLGEHSRDFSFERVDDAVAGVATVENRIRRFGRDDEPELLMSGEIEMLDDLEDRSLDVAADQVIEIRPESGALPALSLDDDRRDGGRRHRAGDPRAGDPRAVELRGPVRGADARAGAERGLDRRSDRQSGEPRAVEPRAHEPRAHEPRAHEPRAHEPRAPDPRAPDPRAPDPRAVDVRGLDPRSDRQSGEPRAVDPRSEARTEPRVVDPRGEPRGERRSDPWAGEYRLRDFDPRHDDLRYDPRTADPRFDERGAERRGADPRAADPRFDERGAERRGADPRATDPRFDERGADRPAADPRAADPRGAERDADPRSAEPVARAAYDRRAIYDRRATDRRAAARRAESRAADARVAESRAIEARAAEARAVEARAAEARAAEARVAEARAVEVRAAEARAAEVRAAEARAAEIREAEARAAEARVAEARAAEARAAEARAVEARVAEARAAEARAAEVRTAEARAAEVRTAELRANEAREARAAEARATEAREAREARAAEARANEAREARAAEARANEAREARAAEARANEAREARAAEIRAHEAREARAAEARAAEARAAQHRAAQHRAASGSDADPDHASSTLDMRPDPAALDSAGFDVGPSADTAVDAAPDAQSGRSLHEDYAAYRREQLSRPVEARFHAGHIRLGNLFAPLPRPVLDRLIAGAEHRTVRIGVPIVRAGDRFEGPFIVTRGRVAREKETDGRRRAQLHPVEPGDLFGLVELVRGGRWRTTARAELECDLLRLPVRAVDEARGDHPRWEQALRDLAARRLADELLAGSGLFGHMDPGLRSTLGQKFAMRVFGSGEMLIESGERVDGLYLVIAGEVDVEHDDAYLTTLGSGDFVGIVAALERRPTRVRAVAATPVEAFHLGHDALRVALEVPEVHAAFSAAVERRRSVLEGGQY